MSVGRYTIVAVLCCLGTVAVKSQGTSLSEITSANTQFAFNLYQALQKADSNENVFFSPFSISTVLAMLYEGAGSNTRRQMGDVAKFSQIQQLGASFQLIGDILNEPSQNYTLRTANRAYASQTYRFLTTYLETIRSQYQSDIIPSDFTRQFETVRLQINQWVEGKTSGKIKDLLPQNSLNSVTAMVLVNAMYFKGDWNSKFSPRATISSSFHLTSTTSMNTDLMYQKAKFNFNWDRQNRYKTLELPYKGRSLSMFLILPDAVDGLGAMEKILTHDKLLTLSQNMREAPVSVYLPKFKIDQKYDMKVILSNMGISDLFSRTCDLSGMDGTHLLYVSNIFHQAFIEVNEEGSEAAAATGAVIISRLLVFPETFKADHPFMFYIRDNRSGSILFMGKFVKPQ